MKRNEKVAVLFAMALTAMYSCTGLAEKDNPGIVSSIAVDTGNPLDHVDVFLYEAEGRRQLITHARSDSLKTGDSLAVSRTRGEMIAVAIANYPYGFNDEALASYETMELLQSYYRAEKPGYPVMSGTGTLSAGGFVSIKIEPLFASVILTKVEHSLGGYARLEEPRIILGDVPESVELLRERGFRGAPAFNNTAGLKGLMWDYLPFDVGLYPQYPETCLKFYPNEDELLPTNFTLECEIGTKTFRFDTKLPPLSRGDSLKLELEVKKDTTYKYTELRK